MIYENLDRHIADAMKRKAVDSTGTAVLEINFWKAVKTEMVNAVHNGIKLPDDTEELKILKMMLKQRKNAIEEFSKSNSDTAMMNKQVNEYEMHELEKLLPAAPNPEEVKSYAFTVIENLIKAHEHDDNFNMKMLQRYTKDIISGVKEKYPLADNGIIAACVKEYMNS